MQVTKNLMATGAGGGKQRPPTEQKSTTPVKKTK